MTTQHPNFSYRGGSAVEAPLKALLNITSWRECSSCSLLWISCSILKITQTSVKACNSKTKNDFATNYQLQL